MRRTSFSTAALITSLVGIMVVGCGGGGGGAVPARPRAWGAAASIESASGDATDPSVAFNASGVGFAVWQQMGDTRYELWARRYAPGEGWSAPVPLDQSGTQDASEPEVAVDANGDATVIWIEATAKEGSVHAVRHTAGTGWDAPTIIGQAEGIPSNARVAADGRGNVLVAWAAYDGTRSNIWAIRYASTERQWGAAQMVEQDDTGSAFEPQIALDGAGNAFAIWGAMVGARRDVWVNRYTAGVGWLGATRLENDDAGTTGPGEIAFDAAGNAVAVWTQSDGTVTHAMTRRYSADAGWGAVTRLSDGIGEAAEIRLAVDAAGNAITVWNQRDYYPDEPAYRESVWASRYRVADGAWATAATIESAAGDGTSSPRIAMDAAGNAVAVWTLKEDTGYSVQANRYTAGAGWGGAQTIGSNSIEIYDPRVAVDEQGTATVLWEQYRDGTAADVMVNRFE